MPFGPVYKEKFDLDAGFSDAELSSASKTGKDVAKVTGIVIGVALVARVAPGAAGRALAKYGGGFEKSAVTGELSSGPLLATNLLPAPFGFAPADLYGLKPNYYLPAGSSRFVPEFFDPIGFGFKQQRAEDRAEAEQLGADDRSQVIRALRSLPTEDLQQFAAGARELIEQGKVTGSDSVSIPDALELAEAELARRRPPELPVTLATSAEGDPQAPQVIDEFAGRNPPDP